LCLTGASLGALIALSGQAWAAEDAAKASDEVVVTATGTNISGVKPVGSEALQLDRQAIQQTGRLTIADVVKTLPQTQNLGFAETAIDTGYGGNFSGAQNASTNSSGGLRGTTINLRGLQGNNATLLLIDGRRIAPSGVPAAFQDAVQLPLSAIERVEVLADGASAIYGSDAISGVVNFVLRKRFEGLEVTGRYNTNSHGDGWSGAATFGHKWDSLGHLGEGDMIFTYEHTYTSPILRGSFPQLRADLRPFGGEDFRFVGAGGPPNAGNGAFAYPGVPGNIVVFQGLNFANPVNPREVNYLYYGLPGGLTGSQVPTASQVLSGLNKPSIVDRSDYEDYQPRTVRDQISAFANQDINSWMSVYFEGFFSKRDSSTRVFQSNNVDPNRALWVQVNPGTPYYISGLTGATNTPYYVQYNLLAHYEPNGGPFLNDNTETTYSGTLGVKVKLPHDWTGEGYGTWGMNNACAVCFLGSFVSSDTPVYLDQLVNQGFINPYSSDPLTKAQVDKISGSNIQSGHNYFNDGVIKFNGPLFKLPGGEVKAALGAEFTYWINRVKNGANRPCDQFILGSNPACATADNLFRWDADSRTPRQQWAFFGEAFIPVIGPDNALPFVQSFDIDAAVRHDRYNRFGTTTNPKLGATWVVSRDIQLRGSWGTSFRAPSIQDTDPGVFSVAVQSTFFPQFSGDPTVPTFGFANFTNALLLIGANKKVGPEHGEHWSIGADITPHFVPGLRLSGTYYDITYENRIAGGLGIQYLTTPGSATSLAFARQFVTVVTPPVGCKASDPNTFAPEVKAALNGSLYGPNTIGFLYGASTIVDPCGIRVIADARQTNLASTHQTGLDLSADYNFPLAMGRVALNGSVSHIFKNQDQAFQGQPVNDGLDRIGYPVSWRGRGSVGYYQGPFGASVAMNYVGSYTNDQPMVRYVVGSVNPVTDPISRVPAWVTFDLSLNYDLTNRTNFFPLKNTRFSVSVLNVFDRDAPVVLTGTVAADVSKHSVLGRQWQLAMTKTF
jgi:iron complex outermembrane receptor protein